MAISAYARSQERLPLDLTGVCQYRDESVDGWKRPIHYEASPDGTVALTSYGKDAKPGGTGEDADIVAVFLTRGPDGNWLPEPQWLTAPLDMLTSSQPASK
ncbi:MAG: type II secretion system protein GspG [Phycisphaerae bacterium]